MTICSTLSGKLAIKHPTLDVMVREDGAVFVMCWGGKKHNEYHWTFGSPNTQGYLRVFINRKSHYVHRLVAEAFLPNPENKPTVDHWNRKKTDNRVSNLRWATYKEQIENSGQAEKCKYGIRYCEDRNAFARASYNAHSENCRERSRKYRQEKGDVVRAKNRERLRKLRADPEYRRKEAEKARQRRAAKKQQKAAQ